MLLFWRFKMTIFTYSEARQNFVTVLEVAQKEGVVIIKRRDGSRFRLTPDTLSRSESPLNVKGVKTKVRTNDIISAVRESRQRN